MKSCLFPVFLALLASIQALAKVDPHAALVNVEIDKCTSIAVGALAGTEGPMNTHTADCSNCDFRINKVPPKDWPAGTMRPLYVYKSDYPATLSPHRGATWHPDNLEGTPEQIAAWGKESVITGYIPQVPHTFGLYEAGYGIMNEHQVAIGESTCASKLWAAPVIAGGKAKIEVREMSMIALERSRTAREAIQIMGDLATSLGFYAADWSGGDASKGEGGEGLTVIDKTEAWVFHVTADDTGASAVWVAQRVPDDHVAVIANQFVIRTIHKDSPDFMYSSNVWDVAKRAGLWDGNGDLDWLLTFAPPRAHSPYATRRVWRVFNIVAPNFKLDGETDMLGTTYPFSVKVEKQLTPQDVMNINRDHYEGTEYDLTQGLAAGPYGNPNRYDPTPIDNMTYVDVLGGSYERSISLFRTSYSFVAQGRANVPDVLSLLWFSQYAPSASSYAPFYVASEVVPRPYMRGNLFKYDPEVSFWNFCAAGNYASLFYKYAMREVKALQDKLMNSAISQTREVEKVVVQRGDAASSHEVVKLLTKTTVDAAQEIVSSWHSLLFTLITIYHDGYEAQSLTSPAIHMQKLFYPKWWLDVTGYFTHPPNKGEGVILFAPQPEGYVSTGEAYMYVGMAVVLTVMTMLTLYGVMEYQKRGEGGVMGGVMSMMRGEGGIMGGVGGARRYAYSAIDEQL